MKLVTDPFLTPGATVADKAEIKPLPAGLSRWFIRSFQRVEPLKRPLYRPQTDWLTPLEL